MNLFVLINVFHSIEKVSELGIDVKQHGTVVCLTEKPIFILVSLATVELVSPT